MLNGDLVKIKDEDEEFPLTLEFIKSLNESEICNWGKLIHEAHPWTENLKENSFAP